MFQWKQTNSEICGLNMGDTSVSFRVWTYIFLFLLFIEIFNKCLYFYIHPTIGAYAIGWRMK